MDYVPKFSGCPKEPSYTLGDDRKLLHLQKKLETSLNHLTLMVEDTGNAENDRKNALSLGSLLRSCFEDVNNLRRSHVAKGHSNCLDRKTTDVPLLSQDEFRKINASKQKSRQSRKPSNARNGFRQRSSSFRGFSHKQRSSSRGKMIGKKPFNQKEKTSMQTD